MVGIGHLFMFSICKYFGEYMLFFFLKPDSNLKRLAFDLPVGSVLLKQDTNCYYLLVVLVWELNGSL